MHIKLRWSVDSEVENLSITSSGTKTKLPQVFIIWHRSYCKPPQISSHLFSEFRRPLHRFLINVHRPVVTLAERKHLSQRSEMKGHGKILVGLERTLFPCITPVELRSVSKNPHIILSLGRSSFGVAFHEY